MTDVRGSRGISPRTEGRRGRFLTRPSYLGYYTIEHFPRVHKQLVWVSSRILLRSPCGDHLEASRITIRTLPSHHPAPTGGTNQSLNSTWKDWSSYRYRAYVRPVYQCYTVDADFRSTTNLLRRVPPVRGSVRYFPDTNV